MIDIHGGLGNRSKIKLRFPALVDNLHKLTTCELGDTRNNLNTLHGVRRDFVPERKTSLIGVTLEFLVTVFR